MAPGPVPLDKCTTVYVYWKAIQNISLKTRFLKLVFFLLQTSAFAMCFLSYSHFRSQFFTFSKTIYFNDITFMTRAPGRVSRYGIVSKPFQRYVWITLAASLIIFTLTLYALKRQFYHLRENASLSDISSKLVEILLNNCKIT